jgi:hypothetical protein
MTNFKLPHKKATRNKINFTTTTKYYANRDENDRLKKNEALFELNPHIKTSSHLANEKSQSPDQRFDLLKKNKQESLDNCHSAELSMYESDKLCNKASTLFSKNKSNLEDEKRKEAEYYANLGAVGSSNPNYNTEEEKSILDIDRHLKRLMGAIYRAKSVQEVVPNPHATNDTVTQADNLITELNTLSHNIKTLTENNNKIITELKKRNISLIEDQLTTFMDMPGDFSDNAD